MNHTKHCFDVLDFRGLEMCTYAIFNPFNTNHSWFEQCPMHLYSNMRHNTWNDLVCAILHITFRLLIYDMIIFQISDEDLRSLLI